MVVPAFQQPFYEAAAQFLLILILVMAVGEYRLRASSGRVDLYVYSLLTFALMLWGELTALAALAGGHDTLLEEIVVIASILSGCIYLMFWLAFVLLDDTIKVTDPVGSVTLFLIAVLVSAIFLMAGAVMLILQAS